ncbi:MAG: hypothetical protein U5J98_05405 [Halobacteriales archaeon]|nr:hypothetical protein [Halobacteriales archaeon]
MPPKVLSKKPPVIGLTKPTTPRLVDWNDVAVSGPTAKTTTFSASNGPAVGETWSWTSFAARPLPPRKRLASREVIDSTSASPVSRWTWSTSPP